MFNRLLLLLYYRNLICDTKQYVLCSYKHYKVVHNLYSKTQCITARENKVMKKFYCPDNASITLPIFSSKLNIREAISLLSLVGSQEEGTRILSRAWSLYHKISMKLTVYSQLTTYLSQSAWMYNSHNYSSKKALNINLLYVMHTK